MEEETRSETCDSATDYDEASMKYDVGRAKVREAQARLTLLQKEPLAAPLMAGVRSQLAPIHALAIRPCADECVAITLSV